MQRLRFAVLAIAVFGLMHLACSHKSPSDQTLTTDIQAKLYADPVTKPGAVTVTVKFGVVTFSGNVPSSDVALEAMKSANAMPGVKRVKDQLTVNGGPIAAQVPLASPYPPPPPQHQAAVETAPQSQPGKPQLLTVPAGERVRVRLIDSIDSAHNTAEQTFRATLPSPLISHGQVIVSAGIPVSVLLTQSKGAGHIEGRSELEVRPFRIGYHGHSYRVDSSIYEETGKARGQQTAARTGIGAAAGAIIGAIAGGGKGAAIGSAAGGGAGFGVNAVTHGHQVRIPSEAELTFRLRCPLTITP